ncbi:MAG: carbohydrate kinase [Eubacteriaceae bacterium]|nr:carbohydrate kinase [Eubacteriaceae bacterium]
MAEKRYDAVALGEALIDFIDIGASQYGLKMFERNPGGAVANAATAMARCGLQTAFIGKVGNDTHGRFLKNTLRDAGVDVSGMIVSDIAFTTLAFVEAEAEGEGSLSFARKPGADMMLLWEEIDKSIIASTKVFHIGSISLTDEPAKSATRNAVVLAKESGAAVTYDPNYRASLWKSEGEAVEAMRSMLPYVDVIKMSGKETELLTGEADAEKAANKLLNMGISLVAVTLGKEGAYLASPSHSAMCSGFEVPVLDTAGAGDAFLGGLVYKLLAYGKPLSSVKEKEIKEFGAFANATAAKCTEKRGAIASMPTVEETERLISGGASIPKATP